MMDQPKCSLCFDNGIVVDQAARQWNACTCAAGKALIEELIRGEEDIHAGRLHRWEDVRRKP